MKKLSILILAAVGFTGCQSSSYLTRQYIPDRADLAANALPNPPAPVTIINPDPTSVSLPAVEVQPAVTGTWTFTTPTTTTRVERRTAEYSQFSIYNGRPAPTDKPFVVITVGPESLVTPDANLQPTATRDYILNGNLAHEATGLTTGGAAFCDLTIRKPEGKGDICHAIAIARTTPERQLALQILSSVTWKANTQ